MVTLMSEYNMFLLRKDLEHVADEPKEVDTLLSKELLQLSLNDRNALEEEIHGVRNLAPEESPELLAVSLREMAIVLDRDDIIPRHEKQAYLRSLRIPRTYIHGDNFRLRFLRESLFDVVKAAKQMVRFLELACFLFGDHLLQRPIRMSDFNKKESQFIRNGNIQFLPFRDRSGRRVGIFVNPAPYDHDTNEDLLGQSHVDRVRHGKIWLTAKLFLYMNWVAGDDVDTQRKGLVWIIWFDLSFKIVTSSKMSGFADTRFSATELQSVRSTVIHLCVPDTPFHRLCAAVIKLKNGSSARMRMKVHYGESVELLYKLQSYGIPTEHIPISFSGTIKTGYIKQWARAREAQESPMYLELANDFRDIIECPQLNDVLFRQGISLIGNPGNARVRTLIEEMHKEQAGSQSHKQVKLKRREMVLDIIEQVGKSSRFLVWNEGGWWNEIPDREHLILKIEYLIKEVRKSKREARQTVNLNSSTSIFYSNKRPKLDERGGNTDSSDEDKPFPYGGGRKGCL